ncbi:MAG: hypothetical protein M0Z94_04270 [Dehalococcoidales bacterium]|nr:hypothetical protein [Dehalococcoidales bacterium]
MDAKRIAAEANSLPAVWSLPGLMALFANYLMPLVAWITGTDPHYTTLEAALRLAVLAACAAAALFVLERYLRWRDSLA